MVMNPKRAGALLYKELFYSSKNVIFIWAIVAPVAISLAVSLVFGTLFTEKPKLGIVDEGNSQMATRTKGLTSVITKEYSSVSEITQAVESGAVDMGIVFTDNFDESIMRGVYTKIPAYVWGQSLARNRIILKATISQVARELAGQRNVVEVEATTLGEAKGFPWNERLLPFVVLMTVFVGGLFLPATAVINEKEKKTLQALVITPTTMEEVFAAKGVFGIVLSLVMGIVILILNQAFGANPTLLILVLALGAIMAAVIGLILGAVIKDLTTLFATWKTAGIVLFGPAIVYMFPQIPEWIGKLFPTYYLIQPIIKISQRGGSWHDIATDVFILVGFDLLLVGVLVFALRKSKLYAI